MIAIIDYDAGNMKSVWKALHFLGEEAVMTRDRDEILACDRVILPGVGAYRDAMERIREFHLTNVIYDVADSGKPFLGICLGQQLLFESSEEGGAVGGLGLIRGRVIRIPAAEGLKIPHMGWNNIKTSADARLFQGIGEDPYVYFVHSYYTMAENPADVAATTEYGVTIHAAVQRNNIYACQFHPEKSSHVGLKILDNFIHL